MIKWESASGAHPFTSSTLLNQSLIKFIAGFNFAKVILKLHLTWLKEKIKIGIADEK
jgi:hypothetical protein